MSILSRKQVRVWTCKDGTRIRICDMDDSHLLNACRLIERAAIFCHENNLSEAYQIESTLNGEMAQVCIAQDISRMECEDPLEAFEDYSPMYRSLLNEIERRALKKLPLPQEKRSRVGSMQSLNQ